MNTSLGTSHPTLPLRSAKSLARLPCSSRSTSKQEPSTSARASEKGRQPIYIGFPKDDYGPREGRKGRVVLDDPRRYPDRDALTGGWAGGEVGLWQYREAIKEDTKTIAKPAPTPKPNGRPLPGKKPIYVGYGKDELELKNMGKPGRIIYDDETKYPGKEDYGVLAGATGGFAGGERGVKAYVETGEVRLRKPGEPGGQPTSPLSIAFILLLGGGLGGILLTDVFDAGEMVIRDDILQAPIDDNTKLLLLGAVGLLGTAVLLGGAKAAVDSVQERLQEAAKNAVAVGGFGFVVLLGARAILEM